MIEPIRFPPKLAFLFKPARFKIPWGGRDAGRSWGVSRALLTLGASKPLRILCAREIQKSIADSVHRLLTDQIKRLGLEGFYDATEHSITGQNGTEFIYTGLRDLDPEKIKSYEGCDIAWVEEAEKVTKKSWNTLIPTIRKDGSEIWATFNAHLDSDDTYQRFIVNPEPGTVAVHMTWRDNPWPSSVLAAGREHMRVNDPAEYENIWEGKCRTSVAGAIYAKEVTEMIESGRARPMPHDPRLPVHTVWDLGWNDSMSILLVQRVLSAVTVIGYLEDSGKTYADCVAELNTLKGYVWGTDWLPHDGAHTSPQTGKNPKQILESLRRKSVQIIPKLDPEHGIRAVRMMFPRLYIDNAEYENDTWRYDGGKRLIECLKRYRRAIPKTTGEPGQPVHDEFSHAADAVRGLATIVDKIRNENERPPIQPAQRRQLDRGTGI